MQRYYYWLISHHRVRLRRQIALKIHSRKKSQRKNIYMYISIVMNLTKLMLLKVALNTITPIHLTQLTWWSESRGWCWSCYNGEKNHNYNLKQFKTMPISYDVRVFNNNTTGVTVEQELLTHQKHLRLSVLFMLFNL